MNAPDILNTWLDTYHHRKGRIIHRRHGNPFLLGGRDVCFVANEYGVYCNSEVNQGKRFIRDSKYGLIDINTGSLIATGDKKNEIVDGVLIDRYLKIINTLKDIEPLGDLEAQAFRSKQDNERGLRCVK